MAPITLLIAVAFALALASVTEATWERIARRKAVMRRQEQAEYEMTILAAAKSNLRGFFSQR